jgi:hypothetical protein
MDGITNKNPGRLPGFALTTINPKTIVVCYRHLRRHRDA